MEGLEEKLGAILNDPNMMGQIMSLAQSLSSQEPTPPQTPPQGPAMPEIDLSALQKITGFARQSSIDSNQQSLLKALGPYLSNRRIDRLEKAMRAAKLAKMASSFLGTGALQSLLGR